MKYILFISVVFFISIFSLDAQSVKKYGVVNLKGEVVVPLVYEEITPLERGYARTMKNGRYGLIDSIGTEVLKCKYHEIQVVTLGQAVVMMNKSYGVINLEDSVVIPFIHKSIKPLPNGFFLAYNSLTSGVYDSKGIVTVPFSTDMLIPFSGDRSYLISSNFLRRTNKVIDCRNNEQSVLTGNHICDMGNGYFGQKIKENTYKILDINAREINPAVTIEDNQAFSGEYLRYMSDGKLGLIDIKGQVVLPPIYKRIFDFQDGYAKVMQDSTRFGDNQYGLVNTNGKEIIRCMYDGLDVLSNGRIMVLAQQKYGFLNKQGQVAIPFEYDSAIRFEDNISVVSKGRHYGVIDIYGRQVLPFEYDRLKYLGKACFAAYSNGKWQIIDKGKHQLGLSDYDSVGDVFAGKYIAVAINRKWGVIDYSGTQILPFEYSSVEGFGNGVFIVRK